MDRELVQRRLDSAKETERLKAPPVSSYWPHQVQLPLKQQTNSKQSPVQSQWTHPVETSEQVPVRFQSTHPIKHRMPVPVKVTCSDGFLGERFAQPPLSQAIEHLPQGTIAPRPGSREEIAQAQLQVVSAPKVKCMRFG